MNDQEPIITKSPLTGNYYLVTKYKIKEVGLIIAHEKSKLSTEEIKNISTK